MAARRALFGSDNGMQVGRRRPDRSARERILRGMADAMAEDAAYYLLEERSEHGRRSKREVEALIQDSDLSREADRAAAALARSMEALNGMPIDDLYMVAVGREGTFGANRDAPEDFGHYMAMEALGHGVAWDDSAPSFPHRVPSIEFHAYIGDDGRVYASFSGPDERFARDRQRGARRSSKRSGRSR